VREVERPVRGETVPFPALDVASGANFGSAGARGMLAVSEAGTLVAEQCRARSGSRPGQEHAQLLPQARECCHGL
jgi:hypothetical protein